MELFWVDLSTKKDEGFFLEIIGSMSYQCFNRQASGHHLGTEVVRLEGVGPIYKSNNKLKKTGPVPLLLASQLGIDLKKAGAPIS
jgi:hypothetical protein